MRKKPHGKDASIHRRWLESEVRGVKGMLSELEDPKYRSVAAWRKGMRRHYKERLTHLRRELRKLR